MSLDPSHFLKETVMLQTSSLVYNFYMLAKVESKDKFKKKKSK